LATKSRHTLQLLAELAARALGAIEHLLAALAELLIRLLHARTDRIT
jgi:hypothetical protein